MAEPSSETSIASVVVLDAGDLAQAAEIHEVYQASYAVEAALLAVDDFPPLRRTVEEIRGASGSTFYGLRRDGRLAAVAEVLESVSPHDLSGFVVHPRFFRRGVGSALLRHLLATRTAMTVSTGAANRPAIALYHKLGFRLSHRWTQGEGIEMVTLRWGG